ncbi:MAG: LamG domain-containing protein [Sedimentisphaerales bacterium]|nr:LamG domain-containing protein [Sedimentisphaerales bacterium]
MSKKPAHLICLVLLLTVAGSASAQLLVHYEFDETAGTIAVDSSGKGNDGVIAAVSATATTVDVNWVPEGWLDGALAFDGTFGITIPAETLGLRSDAGTVAFWMNQPSLAGAINTIWWGGDNTTGGGFGPENEMHIHTEAVAANVWKGGELCFAGQNNPNFHLYSDPNKSEPAAEPIDPILMPDGQWHHVACTWGNEDANVKMYLDGALLHELPQGDRSYALSHIYIGQMANGSRTYNGLLDEFQIYGRALTAEEIQSLTQGILALSYPASLPEPADKVTEVVRDASLRWMMGDTARTHDVYFGTNANDVNEATVADARDVLVSGGQTPPAYDLPGLLDYNETYYWRVDEIEADGTTMYKGPLWSFTIVNFILVDDFERYTDTEPNRIFETWADGWGTNDNGAIVGHIDPDLDAGEHYAGTTVLHKGLQSMPLNYDTEYKYSETVLTLDGAARDWTTDDVQELSLWFRGYPAYQGGFTEAPTGTYTMLGAGADIWGAADECHFAYKEVAASATISIVARVESVSATHDYAKAGVMIRDDLDPNSRYAGVFVTPTQGVRFQWRLTAAAASASEFAADLTAPYWVKLERTAGGLVRAYHSPDGATWTRFSLQSVAMASPACVGLAVTSHAANVACEGVFSHVTVTGSGSDKPWIDQDIGIHSNYPTQIYVALNDSAVVYRDDPNTTLTETWTEWRIPLQAFADQGANLSDVTSFAIGVGTKGDAKTPGGSGLLYIDDVRLYRP